MSDQRPTVARKIGITLFPRQNSECRFLLLF